MKYQSQNKGRMGKIIVSETNTHLRTFFKSVTFCNLIASIQSGRSFLGGRRENKIEGIWSGREDSNLRPLAPHASALNRTAPRPDTVADYTIKSENLPCFFIRNAPKRVEDRHIPGHFTFCGPLLCFTHQAVKHIRID
jgi:hypothetical protein